MELLLTQGYFHIGSAIFQHLDDQSLCQSRLVNHQWCGFIDNQRFYWQRIVSKGKEVCQNEEWQQLFESFKENHYQLSQLLQHFLIHRHENAKTIPEDFFTSDVEDEHEYPYHVPVITQNLDHIAILWPHLHDSVEWNFFLPFCLASQSLPKLQADARKERPLTVVFFY